MICCTHIAARGYTMKCIAVLRSSSCRTRETATYECSQLSPKQQIWIKYNTEIFTISVNLHKDKKSACHVLSFQLRDRVAHKLGQRILFEFGEEKTYTRSVKAAALFGIFMDFDKFSVCLFPYLSSEE